ncbi:MAG: ATP-binding protein [Thermodesulfobacteriota bacterium]
MTAFLPYIIPAVAAATVFFGLRVLSPGTTEDGLQSADGEERSSPSTASPPSPPCPHSSRTVCACSEDSGGHYKLVFRGSNNAVLITDAGGRLVDINPAGAGLIGDGSREGLIGADIEGLLCASFRGDGGILETIDRDGPISNVEVTIGGRDGETLRLELTGFSAHDGEGRTTGYGFILRDITQLKELGEQLLQAQKMEAVGQLTGGIAHDFCNMVMAVNMYSELIKKDTPEGGRARKYAGRISDVTRRAESLTKRLLAFSRKDAVTPRPVELNGVVRSVEKLLLRFIGEDIVLGSNLSEDDITVMADGVQLEQVIMNLATNARDAMPGGGRLTITTGLAEMGPEFISEKGYGAPGTYASITVEDTGAGMEEETRARIFEPFFTTKGVEKGTGLGLSVAYGIVKQHRGYISVETSQGTGTKFTVLIPLAKSPAEEFQTVEPMEAGSCTGTVLLAEDDPAVREVTRQVLEESGYRVIEAVDGEDAMVKFMEGKDDIDLLILDVIMPGKNGREVYEGIAGVRPGVKTIFLSGYSPESYGGRITGPGVDFIDKPVPPPVLLGSVKKVLNG